MGGRKMAWWVPILALFEMPVVGTIFASLLALISVSVLGVLIPSIKTLFAGVVLLLLAYVVPDVTIFQSKRAKITLRNVFGIAGVMCLILLAFGIPIASFAAGTINSVASVMPAGSITDDIKSSLSSIIPEGVKAESVGTIATVFVATVAISYVLGGLAKKRRGRK